MKKEKNEKKDIKKITIIKFLILLLVIVISGLLCGRYISTKGLVVKEYPIKTNLLSEEYDGFKIVQFSDLHYGTTNDIETVKHIVKRINEQNPDVVLFTGDLFDDSIELSEENINELINELNKVEANINK